VNVKAYALQKTLFMTRPQFSILLVDDEKSIHEAFGIALSDAGYRVGYAEDGAIGFQMFLEGSWDAVITDQAMPHMTGEQLAEEIKGISPDTPVILVTGHILADTRLKLFDEVLMKPFALRDFLACVARVVGRPK
jgi:DNA-binding response OmpR family regulator